MTSNNRIILAIGVAGLALFSAFGRSRKMAGARDAKETKKDLTTWEGEGGNPPSKTGTSPTTSPASQTSH